MSKSSASSEGGGYTVVLVPDDTQRTRTIKVSGRALRVGATAAAVVGVFLALMLATWWYFAAQAARIPALESEIARLDEDNARVQQLARNLAELQAQYEKIRGMLGADVLASDLPPEALPAEEPASTDGGSTPSGLSPEIPTSWPLATDGYVTRVLEQAQSGTHPGVDIAVAQGSYIRAAGAGTVREAGSDSIYGLYVLIEHGGTGYRTMYGHASRLFVTSGARVRQNQVIALTGNTGRSTAPHLHFEVLHDGAPIDPFTLVQQRPNS